MELSKVEQRYDAVLAVIRDGLTISEVADRLWGEPPDRPSAGWPL